MRYMRSQGNQTNCMERKQRENIHATVTTICQEKNGVDRGEILRHRRHSYQPNCRNCNLHRLVSLKFIVINSRQKCQTSIEERTLFRPYRFSWGRMMKDRCQGRKPRKKWSSKNIGLHNTRQKKIAWSTKRKHWPSRNQNKSLLT